MADDDTWQEFRDTVNMTAGELEKWLDTDEKESRSEVQRGGATALR
jgi:hypothetical protein